MAPLVQAEISSDDPSLTWLGPADNSGSMTGQISETTTFTLSLLESQEENPPDWVVKHQRSVSAKVLIEKKLEWRDLEGECPCESPWESWQPRYHVFINKNKWPKGFHPTKVHNPNPDRGILMHHFLNRDANQPKGHVEAIAASADSDWVVYQPLTGEGWEYWDIGLINPTPRDHESFGYLSAPGFPVLPELSFANTASRRWGSSISNLHIPDETGFSPL